MPARIEYCEWRQIRWDRHGKETYREMQKKFVNQNFNIQDVANLEAISHLSDRNAYDHATAICRELEVQNKLKRRGLVLNLRPIKRKAK